MSKINKPDNYADKLTDLVRQLGPGIHHTTIQHDEWCKLLTQGGRCNCDPIVKAIKPGDLN